MDDIVILSAVRTPVGAFQGALASLPAHALGARALAAAFERAGVTADQIQQVNMGCVLPAGQGQAPARQAALAAGCPVSTGALTLNKVCGSGMRAVMIAANDLRCGDFQVVAAGGMESMSQAPYLALGARDGLRLGHGKLVDSMIHDGLWDPYNNIHMGNAGALCAREHDITRQVQDELARESYRRALSAQASGALAQEIVPVIVKGRGGETRVELDEEPARAKLDKMASLKPAFDPAGTVTAANASKINDGAASVVLASARAVERRGLEPLARVLSYGHHAQAPQHFTTAPVGAMKVALARAGLSKDDVELYEINEAFAVVTAACSKLAGISSDRVNVRGGEAVALLIEQP